MRTHAVPLRPLDADSVTELTRTARALLAETGGSAAHPDLPARLPGAADSLGERVRHACRPADTADGLYLLRGLTVDDPAPGPTPRH